MLKTIGCQDGGNTQVEFGDYLPFRFWQQATSNEPRLYWRTGNLKSTLLEVEIDAEAGQLIALSLLLPGKVSREFPELGLSQSIAANRYPIIDISGWQNNKIMDEPGALHVFVGPNRLLIALSDSISTKKIIVANNITFGIDTHHFIVWILIDNLPNEKLIELENLQRE